MTDVNAGRGIRTFLIVWLGQLVSLVGSGLTNFALGVWVFQRTGSATEFALISVFAVLPGIIMSPVAGALVDRWDRRRVMIASDTVAALSTVVVALLFFSDQLAIWHIYITATISSTAGAFQYPAYVATTSLLVPKQHLGRAAGMVQAAEAISTIIAPALAGVLVGQIGLGGVIAIDFATFLIAAVALVLVRFPRVPAEEATGEEARSMRRDIVYGWRYLRERPGLFWLTMILTAFNFVFSFVYVLLTPFILSFATAEGLGVVVSAGGGGLLIGSVLMSAWGGPRRRILGIYWYGLGQGATLLLAGLRPDLALIALAMLLLSIGGPIANGSVLALRQSKVAPGVQGRVFAFSRMLSWSAIPLAYLLAGPLADGVFEPAMQPDGALASVFGPLVGVGDGRGIALMYVAAGVLSLLITAAGVAYPRVRRLQEELPDHIADHPPAAVGVPAAGVVPT